MWSVPYPMQDSPTLKSHQQDTREKASEKRNISEKRNLQITFWVIRIFFTAKEYGTIQDAKYVTTFSQFSSLLFIFFLKLFFIKILFLQNISLSASLYSDNWLTNTDSNIRLVGWLRLNKYSSKLLSIHVKAVNTLIDHCLLKLQVT